MRGGILDDAWNSGGDPPTPTTHPQPEARAQLQGTEGRAQRPAVAEMLFSTLCSSLGCTVCWH